MISDNLAAIASSLGNANPVLIAVSKQQPDDRVDEALSLGLRIFGENRVQEAQSRWTHRKSLYPDLQLHLIGPLQTNKVKAACTLFDVIHTLDREDLARQIIKHHPAMPCFIQVNTGAEPQKSGISMRDTGDFFHFCRHDLGMTVLGLMCIPPADEPPALHFGLLALQAKRLGLQGLSMGMSDDYQTALHYGATHIRIGSKLFGIRAIE